MNIKKILYIIFGCISFGLKRYIPKENEGI